MHPRGDDLQTVWVLNQRPLIQTWMGNLCDSLSLSPTHHGSFWNEIERCVVIPEPNEQPLERISASSAFASGSVEKQHERGGWGCLRGWPKGRSGTLRVLPAPYIHTTGLLLCHGVFGD